MSWALDYLFYIFTYFKCVRFADDLSILVTFIKSNVHEYEHDIVTLESIMEWINNSNLHANLTKPNNIQFASKGTSQLNQIVHYKIKALREAHCAKFLGYGKNNLDNRMNKFVHCVCR